MKSFDELHQEINNGYAQILKWRNKVRDSHAEMRELLVERINAMHATKLWPVRDLPQVPADNDFLQSVRIDGTMLVAEFGFRFRNEDNSYDLRIPLRFVAEDGVAVITREAKEAAEQALREKAAKELSQKDERRQQYEKLHREFGAQATVADAA